MSKYAISDAMYNELDKFFAAKTIVDVDRNTFLVCNLVDSRYKITISLVFMRDWHSIESDSYNSVIIGGKGAVFTIPCYWLSIPKELAMEYFMYILDEFYNKEVIGWGLGYTPNTDGGLTGGNNGCGCGCNQVAVTGGPPCVVV